MTETRKPFVLEVEEEADPTQAPAVPDVAGQGAVVQGVVSVASRRSSGTVRFALWAFGALFSLVLSVAAWDFVAGLFARNAILGWLAFGTVLLSVFASVFLALQELLAFSRLARIDALRGQAEQAIASGEVSQARAVVAALRQLYRGRGDTAWGLSRLAECEADVMDADALIEMAEGEILAPLDVLAQSEVKAAVARVAAVTAIIPMAMADVAAALYSNLRMIRRISEFYGGRSGRLGSWRLMRKVIASLVATGAVALADDLVGSVAGGGILSRLSRRFGEGVVNGALTARIGIAAMEACRPLPFRRLQRPGVTALVASALKGLVPQGRTTDESPS